MDKPKSSLSLQITPEELRMASGVAYSIGRRWRMVEEEDLASHLYLWLYENARQVAIWRMELGTGSLYVTLRREALKYCAKETAASISRPLETPRFYTVEVVKRALPYVWEDTPSTLVSAAPLSGKPNWQPYDSDVAQAIMADVRAVYHGLPSDLRKLLEFRFRHGLSYEEIALLQDTKPEATRKTIERAVKRLSSALG
jgi:DNA-directed RNA polymerase specialized sigma24 family protein